MRTFTLLAALWLPILAFAQNDDKRDYIWLFGYPPNVPAEEYGGAKIDFKSGYPQTSFFNINYVVTTSSVISDKNGELAFYSNGCHILNKNHEIMKDGSPLNPGNIFDDYCIDWGYPVWQSIISLPMPSTSSHYAVFHLRGAYVNNIFSISDILYSEINMNDEGGLGRVINKNTLLLKDNFAGNISAVRHGNGRDWWVVSPNREGTKYCVFLLTPNGVKGPFFQVSQNPLKNAYPGQVIFSPDGSWFADSRGKNLFRVARFDRCTGKFFDERVFDLQGDLAVALGASFSPNSKVLYISSPLKIYQYDLSSADIATSRKVVAEYDGFKYKGLSTTFFQSMLAPDGKIYLTSTNSSWHLHIIHHPDSLDLACDIEQHALKLPGNHVFNIPNFPHFRLYDLHGSPCDTLGINGPVSSVGEPKEQDRAGLILYPVPATDLLNVQFGSSSGGQWRITDLSGRTLLSGQHPAGIAQATISVASLPSGSYSFSFQATDGTLNTRLFTVLSR